MSGAKFYVLGGGRWRELDTSAGRVEGWGPARFLFVERGRLRAVRRAPVLRGLRALAAGRARTARDGAPLSQIRHTKAIKENRSLCELHSHCQHAYYGCNGNAQFKVLLPVAPAVHAGVQADLSRDLCHEEAAALPRESKKYRDPVRNVAYQGQNKNVQKKRSVKNKQTDILVPHRSNVMSNSADEDVSASVMEWNRKRKLHEKRGAELCKELIIAEEDIMLLRNYIEKDEKNLFNVDLERFDADDTYKSKVFYKLNPLVNVERCKAIAYMAWEQQSQSTVTLKDFITNLGLRRVDDPSPSRSSYRIRKKRDAHNPSEQNKENLASKRQPKVKKRSNNVLGESVGGKPNRDRVKGKVKSGDATTRATRGSQTLEESVVVELSDSDDCFERPGGGSPAASAAPRKREGGGREYSPAEDAAIVRWVRAAGRAHLVNGNRLWRELQPEHQRLTGHFRSWHSLRNRYLRYVLPSLGELLPAPAAAALRAAAARGEIKARRQPRRHSLLAAPPVHSAWARRPRPRPPIDPDATALERERRDGRLHNVPEPPCSLRASAPSVAPAHAHTPTYSELTKRFAEQHRSTPNSDTSEVTEPDKIERRASKRLRARGNADFSNRLDDVSNRQTNTSDRRAENMNDADTSDKQTTKSEKQADRSNRNADNSVRRILRSSRNADTSSRHADDRSQTTDSTDRREHRTRRLYNHKF